MPLRTDPASRAQRGFIMALALATAVVMGLLLMKAIPPVIAQVQRENENELIFRGEAIQAALRAYSAKTGRFPKDLDEVMKVRPRILRQKYKDPMTPSGEWEFITQVQPGASGNAEGLPIIGVRSRGNQDGIHIYQNREQVHDWVFSADQNLLGAPGGAARTQALPRLGKPAASPTAPPKE